jgi:hypothetical protein
MVHLGPRISAAIEDELENVIEGLRAARGDKPPDVRNDAAPIRGHLEGSRCVTK